MTPPAHRIVLAPDKFKGTYSAAEVCRLLREGILAADPTATVAEHPLADGGEGTLDVILGALGGTRVSIETIGPLGDPLRGEAGRLEDGAIVLESALFCGLGTLPADRRNPMKASTYGFGVALAQALSWKSETVLIGLGGTATVDGGLGAARALGYRMLDENGDELQGSGDDLLRLRSFSPPRDAAPFRRARITALCDVRNPLLGPLGAAGVFSRQKGATEEESRRLEAGLGNLAAILHRDLGIDLSTAEGGGAAGGLGAGLMAMAGATLTGGARWIMEKTGLLESIASADLVVTGEGSYEPERHPGKVASEVSSAARSLRVPVVVVCGRSSDRSNQENLKIIEGGPDLGPEGLKNIGKNLAAQEFS